MPHFKTTGPLAKDEVGHVGVAVAMVIAETRYQAEDAAFSDGGAASLDDFKVINEAPSLPAPITKQTRRG